MLSLVTIDTTHEFKTWDLIPPESWEEAQIEHSNRWAYSFALFEAWEICQFPLASTITPTSYSALGRPEYFGSVVEVAALERDRLLDLEIDPLVLKLQKPATRALKLAQYVHASTDIKKTIYRMADLIHRRVQAAGQPTSGWNPHREANPPLEIQQMLFAKWTDQQGRCGLCHRPVEISTANQLLQASPDRIDSENKKYSPENVQITHLACNLAKNRFSVDDFESWLEVVTGPLRIAEED